MVSSLSLVGLLTSGRRTIFKYNGLSTHLRTTVSLGNVYPGLATSSIGKCHLSTIAIFACLPVD